MVSHEALLSKVWSYEIDLGPPFFNLCTSYMWVGIEYIMVAYATNIFSSFSYLKNMTVVEYFLLWLVIFLESLMILIMKFEIDLYNTVNSF